MPIPDPPVPRGALVLKTTDKQRADLKVFVTTDRGAADACVYETRSAALHRSKYIWCWTQDRSHADFAVYLTPKREDADLVICFVKLPSQAGASKRPGAAPS